MKRILMTCLVFVLVACMSISVVAAEDESNGGFNSSPSRNPAPTLVGANNGCTECEMRLIITAYADRDELSEEARKAIEEAYAAIVGAKELSSLNEALIALAKKMGVSPESLVVSDLFDISAVEEDGHKAHGHYEITLRAQTLENFVCLLHYYEGEWHIVDNATAESAGDYNLLTFTESKFSPFAIVVSTEDVNPEVEEEEKPKAPVGVILAICVPAALVLGGAGWYGAAYYKKQKGGAAEANSSKK